MNLKELPEIFENIAGLLEIKGENPFKIRAYQNAAKIISQIDGLEEKIKDKRLTEIKGIGEAIAKKIEEYYKTGSISYYDDLKRDFPLSLLELRKIPTLGPKKIKTLYEKLGITNIGELEYACKENRLLTLFRIGKRTQDRILKGIEFFKKHKDEFLLAETESQAEILRDSLKARFASSKVDICGSIRRKKEVVRDIDIITTLESREALNQFLGSFSETLTVISSDNEKTTLKLKSGVTAEIRRVKEEEYPYALLYFTGSDEHIAGLAPLFQKRGLNIWPIRATEKKQILKTEEEIYNAIGLDFIPPELREGYGEIEAAASKKLPELVKMEDIRGALHVHTNFSDGLDSLKILIDFSKGLGLEYIGISDHSRSAYYARGLKIENLKRQWALIDEINRSEDSFFVFKGIESDILPDGSLDYPDDVLKQFDFVIASIHSHFNLSKKEQMERIIKALKNPYVTIFGHPTGRLLLYRDGYSLDMEEIIEISINNGIVIELNASPYRLDIDWRHLKYAKNKGLLISINPDAHSKTGLSDIKFGVAMARKGWLEKKDVLNAKTSEEIKNFFNMRRR
ncbi:MAG: DNA polymerase/3'-5' exonuclease PolX [Deltaproteobacteria bacterium]|nr:DNA polymerase/3'-5' exonuclease PolX [Deltaproteobacteria bacterium]